MLLLFLSQFVSLGSIIESYPCRLSKDLWREFNECLQLCLKKILREEYNKRSESKSHKALSLYFLFCLYTWWGRMLLSSSAHDV